jgi:ribosomal protein L11 methyltransferase
VPYRLDLRDPPDHAFETLIELGALDVEEIAGGLAAIMPDAVASAAVADALRVTGVRVSPAVGRDDDSVWILSPRPTRAGRVSIVPAGTPAPPDALKIVDAGAFGTGLHLTTTLCLEAMDALFDAKVPARVLDVGTGSGILALAALRRGVGRAVGLDMDAAAMTAAAENARINGLSASLFLVRGGPDAVRGSWPLVVANIRAAELMAMAPVLVQRVASHGHLVLSGIPSSAAGQVMRMYQTFGMTPWPSRSRGSWTVLVLRASW